MKEDEGFGAKKYLCTEETFQFNSPISYKIPLYYRFSFAKYISEETSAS